MPGECIIKRREDGAIEIVRADPLVLISNVLVEEWEKGHTADGVTFGDHILTIRGINRTVSYGLAQKCETHYAWLAIRSGDAPDNDQAI